MSPALIWFLVGVGFLLAELVLPGLILIFFCFGAWIVALCTALLDLRINLELGLFLLSSLTLLFLLRKYCMRVFAGRSAKDTDAEMDATRLHGTALVTKRILPDHPGEIKFRGSFWRATSDVTMEKGAGATVIGPTSPDGLTYRVKPIKGDNHDQ